MRCTALAAILLTGCAAASRTTTPSPNTAPPLPPVPLVQGPLAPKVVYPVAGSVIQSRDSNFIFGSVGNGRATLTINGVPVKVLPNGSFLAYLAVPPPELSRYDLVAALGSDTVRLSVPVKLRPPPLHLLPDGPLVVDTASLTPSGRLALRDDELVRVSLRAPPNATVWLVAAGGESVPLVNDAAMPGQRFSGAADGVAVTARYAGNPELWATDVPAKLLRARGELIATRGTDTVCLQLPSVAPVSESPIWALLGA